MAFYVANHDSLARVRPPPYHNETYEGYAAGHTSKLHRPTYPGELGDAVP